MLLMRFKQEVVGLERRQSVHFYLVAIGKGDQSKGMCHEGNSFPSWRKILPVVLHHNGLNSVETREGTFFKRSEVSAVCLSTLRVNEQLWEEGLHLDLLLASDNRFNHLLALLLGSSPFNENALTAFYQIVHYWHFLHIWCCSESRIQKRNQDHWVEPSLVVWDQSGDLSRQLLSLFVVFAQEFW